MPPPSVTIKHDKLIMQVRKGTTHEQRQVILQEWYRQKLKELVPKYLSEWEKKLNVKAKDFGIKKMRTKWGTCSPEAERIWINLELAKKPLVCLEYIIVHELIHLIERSHNDKFVALMNRYLPNWQHIREELNRLPISHTEWNY